MAEFNPDVGNIPSSGLPDFTGASRGATPNRAFEALFQGVGNLVSGTASLVDTSIKRSIETDVRTGFETLNEEAFGSIPPELANSTSGLQALQTAYDQGKITDTYYYGNLNKQLKALRSKYPGYEDFIDSTMQSVTGVRPANAYRNAILQEIADIESEQTAATRDWDTWVKQNEADIIRVFPDYFVNPGKYDPSVVRQKTVELKGNEAFIQSENARINFLANQDQLTTEAATEAATTALIQQANTFISGQSNALGFDSTDFMQRVASGLTGGFTEEEHNQILGQLNIAESQLRASLLQSMNRPLEEGSSNSYASIIGLAETNKLVDEAMAQFNLIKKMVTDENYGMAGYYTRLNDLRQQRDNAKILDASPELRSYNALAEIDPALAEIWLREGGNQQNVLNALTPEIMARIVTGEDTFNGAIDRIDTSTKTQEDKSAMANTLIDSALATITSGTASPEQLATAVESIYTVDSDGRDVFSIVRPEEYSALYQRMFNPQVTQALTASGDTVSLQKYYEAARERMTAIPEFRQIAARVQDKVDWSKGINVTFDPNTGRLLINADVTQSNFNSNGPLGTRGFESVVRDANEAVTELNNVFSLISPMLDGLGVDQGMKGQIFLEVMRDLNVDIERGKQEGFFDWMEKNVAPIVQGAANAVGGVIQQELQNTSDMLFSQEPSSMMLANPDDLTQEQQEEIKSDFKFNFLQEQAAQGIQYDRTMTNLIDFELDGKIRNKPTSDFWNGTVSSILSDMPRGVGVVVVSGGQDATGPNRTGSHRHDVNEHGESDTADVVLTQNGKKVTPSEAPELYADFLRRAAYMGFEGIGHYPWGVHIGMGSRAAWGPDKTSASLDPLFGGAIQQGWNTR